jgi:hypothetical protein
MSWGVYPDTNGSSIIVHNLANSLGRDKVIVMGESMCNEVNYDKLNYQLIHLRTNMLPFKRGIKYHKWLSFFYNFYKANKILKEHNCIRIIAVFPDEYFLCLSFILAKFNKIQLYPWFHNTYVENRQGIFKVFGNIIQPYIFKYATKMFCISDGLTQYFKDTYRNRNFYTVRHAFVISSPVRQSNELNSDRKLTFAYSGSMNDSCRDAVIRICKILSIKENCKLIIFGKRNAEELISAGIDSNRIQSFDFLNQIDFENKLGSCDFMILAHGFRGALSDVEYQTIFPTRTVPLLYGGRPIIAHVHHTAYLSTWLKENNCAFVVESENELDISNEIDEIIRNVDQQEMKVKNAVRLSYLFESKTVADELLRLINYRNFE